MDSPLDESSLQRPVDHDLRGANDVGAVGQVAGTDHDGGSQSQS